MTRTQQARTDILRAIRRNLDASAPHDALAAGSQQHGGRLPILTATPTAAAFTDETSGVPRFRQQLEAIGGRCIVVHGEAEAAQALSRIVHEAGARHVAISGAPLIQRLLQAAAGDFVSRDIGQLTRADLFACDAGVTSAQWGIAETGTLVLESAREQNRLASLVPRVLIAILRAENVCETLGEALERVRSPDAAGELASRAITLITGPSRTSDIELTLVIGVHGPQELHVILLSDGSPGDTI
jgi:L-lactate dehydrogenase complex protein LldG